MDFQDKFELIYKASSPIDARNYARALTAKEQDIAIETLVKVVEIHREVYTLDDFGDGQMALETFGTMYGHHLGQLHDALNMISDKAEVICRLAEMIRRHQEEYGDCAIS